MVFLVHNGARSRTNRALRALQPVHGGLKQFICDGSRRLVRGRPVQLTEDEIHRHLAELQSLEAKGLIHVTVGDGRPFSLARCEIEPGSPVANTRPEMPLDSAARDDNQGMNMNPIPHEAAPPAEFTMPVPPPAAAVDIPVTPDLAEAADPEATPVLDLESLPEPDALPAVEPLPGMSEEVPGLVVEPLPYTEEVAEAAPEETPVEAAPEVQEPSPEPTTSTSKKNKGRR